MALIANVLFDDNTRPLTCIKCREISSNTFTVVPKSTIVQTVSVNGPCFQKFSMFAKWAGSRNVNKLLSKRRFCSDFDRPHHRNFPLFFSK